MVALIDAQGVVVLGDQPVTAYPALASLLQSVQNLGTPLFRVSRTTTTLVSRSIIDGSASPAIAAAPASAAATSATSDGCAASHPNSATSTQSPGPNAIARQGPGAPLRRKRSRMNSRVGDDMLPQSLSTDREGSIKAGSSSRVSDTAERMRGPPGCTAQQPIDSSVR